MRNTGERKALINPKILLLFMAKGFIFAFGGAFIAVIVVAVILLVLAYIFGPNYIPNSPCLLDSHCKPQKLCCTWRCDSTELSWWTCTDSLCNLLGKPVENPGLTCGCRNLRCIDTSTEAE